MDIVGILGLLIAFGGVIAGYILEGGTMGALLLVSPALIVIGGTVPVEGYAYYKPIADNETEDGMAQNRRVGK